MKTPLILTAAIAILLSGCQIAPPQDNNDENVLTNTEENQQVETPTPEVTAFVQPDPDFTLPESITNLLESENQNITGVFGPESLTEEDPTVYLTTSLNVVSDPDFPMSTNRIYSYNTATEQLTLYYQETEGRLLRAMAMDGSKLIVMTDGIDNSPGPCFSPFADWTGFMALDVDETIDGLNDYTIPENVVEEAKKDTEECETMVEN